MGVTSSTLPTRKQGWAGAPMGSTMPWKLQTSTESSRYPFPPHQHPTAPTTAVVKPTSFLGKATKGCRASPSSQVVQGCGFQLVCMRNWRGKQSYNSVFYQAVGAPQNCPSEKMARQETCTSLIARAATNTSPVYAIADRMTQAALKATWATNSPSI